MISTNQVTTYDTSMTKVKTFFFNRHVEKPEKEAKKFCRENKMIYISWEEAEPYTLSTWQHYKLQTFKAECTTRTPRFFYEFGKL